MQTRNLSIERIKLALQHCKRPAGQQDCQNCPYVHSKIKCTTCLLTDTISLLDCQRAELNQYAAEQVSLMTEVDRLKAVIQTLTAQNMELSQKGEKVCIALKEESKKAASLQKFKEYFDGLYGCDLEVLGWHENGDTISFDEFYDSAIDEMESTKQKECKDCLHYSACKGTYYTAKGDNGLAYDFDGEMYADSGCEDYKKVVGDKNNG